MNIIQGNIVDVINKRIFKGEIHFTSIIHNIIEKDIDSNVYIMPGFVDAHVHIESSMLTPTAFAKYAIKHGTVAVVTDPHEIANVCGINGIKFMMNNAKQSHLKIFFTAPSCVPATNFETSGATLNSNDIHNLLTHDDFVALSEMMNFPGVINKDDEVWKKINMAKQLKKPIDGHAPLLLGDNLKTYISAGISTDHECSSLEEATEKIKLGMKIQIREGSAAKNFNSLYPLIDMYPDSVMLCTDDSHPDDLIKGHINKIVHMAFDKNLDYFNILRSASYNSIKHYKLKVGLLQENDPADFIICNDIYAKRIIDVYIDGVLQNKSDYTNNNVEIINVWNPIEKLTKEDLKINKSNSYHVIECEDGELLTNDLILPHGVIFNSNSELKEGYDKIIVVNRYYKTKPVVGIIKGINLKQGAFGSTVAHDSHNIIIVGHDDENIQNVYYEIIKNKGGLAASLNQLTYSLALPIAGLISIDSAEIVAEKYHQIEKFVKTNLGTSLTAPFMTLSFMALLVIPEIKIGDRGLFKINQLSFVPLYVD